MTDDTVTCCWTIKHFRRGTDEDLSLCEWLKIKEAAILSKRKQQNYIVGSQKVKATGLYEEAVKRRKSPRFAAISYPWSRRRTYQPLDEPRALDAYTLVCDSDLSLPAIPSYYFRTRKAWISGCSPRRACRAVSSMWPDGNSILNPSAVGPAGVP